MCDPFLFYYSRYLTAFKIIFLEVKKGELSCPIRLSTLCFLPEL